MAKRKLKLNELSRYHKNSPNLVLEEHDHCEVPAGCGGVVLRWRDPKVGSPTEIHLFVAAEAEILLDGEAVTNGRPIIPFGRHVLGLKITKAGRKGLFLFCARRSWLGQSEDESAADEAQQPLLSRADGTWKHAPAVPDEEAWHRPQFDDSQWRPMVRRTIPRPAEDDYGDRYRYDELINTGAKPLGATLPSATVYVRRHFTLSEEGIA